MENIILFTVILSVSIGGCLTILFLFKKNMIVKHKLEILQMEKLNLENKMKEEQFGSQQLIAEQKNEIYKLRDDLQQTKEKSAALEYEKTSNANLKSKVDNLSNELHRYQQKIAILETEKNIFIEQRNTHIKEMKELQENVKLQFEVLGNKIFGENTKLFSQESQTKISELINPLKIDMEGFKKKLEESFGAQAKDHHSLKNEIERIVKVNEQMTSQTTNLTKALKGDFKTQGNWGEIILERILEESGLRQGEDYILQGAELGMKHPDTGHTLKPDVIIKLPEERHLIIDSKVSLTDYEKYFSEEDEIIRAVHLKQFLHSVKKHVNDLEQRRYQDVEKIKTPDFVLMFMPIEGAFSLAIQQDRELHSFAWGKKVVMVSPSTLFATLRTISSIWRLELQHKHALEIARHGGLLYDKIASFIVDMQKLGYQLNQSQMTYAAAMNKLQDGKGNILTKTQQLQVLGAKTSKNLLKIIPDAFNEESKEDETSSEIV